MTENSLAEALENPLPVEALRAPEGTDVLQRLNSELGGLRALEKALREDLASLKVQ